MKKDQQIIEMFHKHHGGWGHGGSKQMTNTRDCQAFYAGDFMSYTDRLQYADGRGNKKSVMVQFNKVKPYVNAVRGFMAQNRQKADYSAKHENSEAQQFYTKYSNSYKVSGNGQNSDDPLVVNASTSRSSNFAYPPRAVRLITSNVSGGSITFSIVAKGVEP